VCAYEVDQFARRLSIDPQRIRLIPNGAEPLPVDEDIQTVATGAPLISSVGRLERYKGHHRLVAAMPVLLEIAPDARLVIVGRGSYERQLRRLVTRLRVERAVTFTSFDVEERAALGALIRSSDIVALMSEYEANPVALMEAIALGRKILVADTSGLSEFAADGLATAVRLHAPPSELAKALVSVAAAPGPKSCRLPTWDHCVDELLRVYAETVPPPG
jgi:glycosyltransferase involved in cell wall biosynthesis